MKKFDEAIKELTLVEVKYGFAEWNAKALLEIGKALQGKGDTAAAVKVFKEVVAKYGDTDAATVAKNILKKLSPS
jgi:TolA-binding protein